MCRVVYRLFMIDRRLCSCVLRCFYLPSHAVCLYITTPKCQQQFFKTLILNRKMCVPAFYISQIVCFTWLIFSCSLPCQFCCVTLSLYPQHSYVIVCMCKCLSGMQTTHFHMSVLSESIPVVNIFLFCSHKNAHYGTSSILFL